MNICLVSTLASNIHNSRNELIQELEKKCTKFYIIGDEKPKDVVVASKFENILYHQIDFGRFNTNPLKEMANIYRFYKFFKERKIAIVLVYGIRIASTVAIAAKLAGVKKVNTIINGAGTLFNNQSFKGLLVKALSYPLLFIGLHCNNTIFFQNKDNKIEIEKQYFLRKDKNILLNGSGVNTLKFTPIAFPKEISFTFIGRLIRDKGIFEFLEAAKRIKKTYNEINITIVGSFDENITSLKKQDLDPYLNEKIINHIEWTDNIQEVLKNTSVFVLPSYHEGTPRTSLEALATGRPIITTDVPGCKETVVDQVNGFLIPKQDETSLELKMLEYIQNPKLIYQHGTEGRKLAVEKFDVNKVNEMIISTAFKGSR